MLIYSNIKNKFCILKYFFIYLHSICNMYENLLTPDCHTTVNQTTNGTYKKPNGVECVRLETFGFFILKKKRYAH